MAPKDLLQRWFGKRVMPPPEIVPEPVVEAVPLPEPAPKLFSVDPPTLTAAQRIVREGHCNCTERRTKGGKAGMPSFHIEAQDETAPGWARIVTAVDAAAVGKANVLEPSALMTPEDWADVITLPKTIAGLAELTTLRLYGSHLRRLPPEIGRLVSLEELDVYTSYSLHWLPYEVTRCKRLRDTRMSTRALYGNAKTGVPFPRLEGAIAGLLPETCSVCDQPFGPNGARLFWTTLRIGTDTTPLLIHSCSTDCLARVPDAPDGYFPRPHRGGIWPTLIRNDRGPDCYVFTNTRPS